MSTRRHTVNPENAEVETQVTTKLTVATKRTLEREAQRQRRSLSAQIAHIVEDYASKLPDHPPAATLQGAA